jgi:hypothetical protein
VTTEPVLVEEAGQRRTEQLRVYFGASPAGRGLSRIGYWCSSCRVHEVTVMLVPARGVPALHVRIVAPNDSLQQQYLFDAIEIVDTIERYLPD